MAKLHNCYPSSPLTKESPTKCKKIDKNIRTEKRDHRTKEPAGPHSSTRLGGNFPTSVAARKSITAWSHFSMENSSETCTCLHLPAFQPVAFPTAFQSALCWVFHRLQWRKRCSRIWA